MSQGKTVVSKAEYGSDIVVDMLKAYGIEYVALNPGATFRGLQDSVVNYGGNTNPEVIEVCHEEIAVAISHGYFKAKGKPMAVLLHDTVGLLHASMAMFNAFVDKVPVLVMGGTGPMDITKRRPWIDWIHTGLLQGNLVREYVKWDDQPASVSSFPESIMRGYRSAMIEPKGPVYLCFDADLQEEKLTEPMNIPRVELYPIPAPAQGDLEAMNKAARLLVEASNPVILADAVGRNPSAVDSLVELAETLSAPVIDLGSRLSFPKTHPLDLTGSELRKDADLILALDTIDLYGAISISDRQTRATKPLIREDAKVIQISLRDLYTRSTITDFQKLPPVDLSIAADTITAIPYLTSLCKDLIKKDPTRESIYRERFLRLKAEHDDMKTNWLEQAKSESSMKPISTAWLAHELWEVIKNEDWVVASGSLSQRTKWEQRLWAFDRPNLSFGANGGAGLGYGLAASIGVALANRGNGKIIIDLQPDGDLLMTTSAIWTATHHKIPIFVVMHNNRCYNNDYQHSQSIAKFRGRDPSTAVIGNAIDSPAPDFATIARGFGAFGIGPVEDPSKVRDALREGLEIVKKGNLALVDVYTQLM